VTKKVVGVFVRFFAPFPSSAKPHPVIYFVMLSNFAISSHCHNQTLLPSPSFSPLASASTYKI
jgi:hypothetical protein